MSDETREKDAAFDPTAAPEEGTAAGTGALETDAPPSEAAAAEGPADEGPEWRGLDQPAEGPDADAGMDETVVRPVRFGRFEEITDAGERSNIDLLLDVKLPVTVELGRTEALVRDILDYGPGSVIELAKQANEPVDLYVNGVLVARGEVVVIDDRFGVRLISLISPEERILTLGGAA